MNASLPAASHPAFAAYVDDEESLATLRQVAAERKLPSETVVRGDIAAATTALAKGHSPQILIVEIADAKTSKSALNALADVCEPETRVIVCGVEDSYRYVRELMDLGVADYLLKPFTAGQVSAALFNPTPAAVTSSKPEETLGTLIAVMGTRGGIGATTIAVNLAHLLAAEHQAATALFDLDAQFGACALALDLEAGRGLRDALAKPDRVDHLFIERVMTPYEPNFTVLASEEPLDEPLHIHPQAPEKVLGALRRKFRYVVVDVPRTLDPFSRYVLVHADHVLLIAEPSILSLRDALRLLDLVRDKLKNSAVKIVLNRVGMLKRHEMATDDFQKSLGVKIDVTIPFEASALACANKGKLLAVVAKTSRAGKELLRLAAAIAGVESAPPQSSFRQSLVT